jgi:hypothetical protein
MTDAADDNRLVHGVRRCQNCEMLRHSDVKAPLLVALWVGVALACGSAAPIDVGTDVIAQPAIADDPDNEPEDLAGQMTLDPAFDAFLDAGWERGTVSPYCHTSFEACGGLLAGTWQVEDNCNPEIRTRDVLQNWGRASMDLDDTACWNAVQRLTLKWSGLLRFEKGEAIDERERTQRVDVRLDSTCLSASFGIEPAEGVSPETCEGMQNDSTTCALAGGVCLCSNRSVADGSASGVYGVLGVSVAIRADEMSPTSRYEYCVEGDTLLWREKEGDQRQVVLKRIVDAAAGETDPVEVLR